MISKEGSWWTGKLNGVQGVFPSNYVQQKENRAPTPPTTSHPSAGQGVTVLGKPVIAKVVAAYTRTKDSQLNLAPGDLVKVHVHVHVHCVTHAWYRDVYMYKDTIDDTTLYWVRESNLAQWLCLSHACTCTCAVYMHVKVCVCVCVCVQLG